MCLLSSETSDSGHAKKLRPITANISQTSICNSQLKGMLTHHTKCNNPATCNRTTRWTRRPFSYIYAYISGFTNNRYRDSKEKLSIRFAAFSCLCSTLFSLLGSCPLYSETLFLVTSLSFGDKVGLRACRDMPRPVRI